jgi:hypothetical protein
MSQDLRRNYILARTGLLSLCLLPSLLLTAWGLARPYDAIPDQDLLWASEALRAIRGVAPSYADHPGAFWSIVFRINISALQLLKENTIVDSLGRITPTGINSLITVSRIENGIICGLTGYLLFPLSRALSIPERLSALIALITAYSSAILVGVSEIRHETVGVAFLMLSTILFSETVKQPQKSRLRYIYTAGSVATFFASAFCKNQTLLLFPAYFAACVGISSQQGYFLPQFKSASWPRKSHDLGRNSAVITLFGGVSWAISATPDIDLINLPFWSAINSCTALLISIQLFGRATWKSCYKSLAILALIEITIFRLLTPQWWRQSITGFPSWMFRYANANENPQLDAFQHSIKGIYQYFSAISFPAQAAIVLLVTITLTLTAGLLKSNGSPHQRKDMQYAIISSLWLFSCAITLANSQRIAARYEIYIILPLITTAAYTTSAWRLKAAIPGFNTKSAASLMSTILVISIGIRSTLNIQNLQSFILNKQPLEWICFGQHMDRSMALTTAGKCDVFSKASKEKDHYDSWWGPQ